MFAYMTKGAAAALAALALGSGIALADKEQLRIDLKGKGQQIGEIHQALTENGEVDVIVEVSMGAARAAV